MGIRENNFNGKGIGLDAEIHLTEESLKGSISYTHPNFAYSDRALTTALESTSTDKLNGSGYKTSLNKVLVGTRYEQFENLFFAQIYRFLVKRLRLLQKHHQLLENRKVHILKQSSVID